MSFAETVMVAIRARYDIVRVVFPISFSGSFAGENVHASFYVYLR